MTKKYPGALTIDATPDRLVSRALVTTLLGSLSFTLPVQNALAQEKAGSELESVVVTATAVPTEYEKVGSSLTVVSSKLIEDGGYTYVPDVLRQVPGLAVSRTGPYGGLTQVRTRGAEGNHTVVLFNGVDISSASQGETDLSTLLAVNIDRIEVLRGPQSGLYGSNALAGVINILTRKNFDGAYYNSSAEYGSHNTTTLLGGGGIGNGKYYVDGGVGLLNTDGFDTSALGAIYGAPGVNGDKEGNRNLTAYLSGGAEVSPVLRFDGFARYVDTHAETDAQDFSYTPGIQGLTYDDASETSTQSYNLAGAGTLSLLEDRWITVASASYTHSHSTGEDGTPGGEYGSKSYRAKYGLQSSFKFGGEGLRNTLTGFVENKKEWYQNLYPYSATQAVAQKRTLLGVGVQDQVEIANQLYLSGTLRHDDNDDFKDEETYSLAASWVIRGSGTRPHASYGKGVTNPSFSEQFGYDPGTFVGNATLQPERALGWDVGVEQTLAGGRAVLDFTYFRSTLQNEIYSCYPSVCNETDESQRKGVELTARIFPTHNIDVIGSYTYLKAEEGNPSVVEVRRPKNQAALDTSWRSLADQLQLTLGVTYNSTQYDNDYRQYGLPNYVALKTKMPSYTVARFAASYKFAPQFEVFGRIENLFDEEYEEVIGYQTPGRTAYIGVRFTGGKVK